MAVVRYKKYLRVLKLWPTSSESRTRFLPSLDQHLAQQVKKEYENETMDKSECDKNLKSLETLLEDKYLKMYPRSGETGCFLQTQDETKNALEHSFEKYAKRQDKIAMIKSVFSFSKPKND